MRVLVLSATFPSAAEPTRGIFVFERIRRLAERCDVVVVAPVPWFPFNRWIRRAQSTLPAMETVGGLTVYHPRVFSIRATESAWTPRSTRSACCPSWCACAGAFRSTSSTRTSSIPTGGADAARAAAGLPGRGHAPRQADPPAGYRLHRPQLRWMLQRADRVVAVSDYLRGTPRRSGSRSRVRVLRNGVDPAASPPWTRPRPVGCADSRSTGRSC